MSSNNIVNTKLEAYKLIHDPVHLLCLLYSKYGDIEEDQNNLYINQILYDKSSHYNVLFKEYEYLDFIDEFLKRFYFIEESFIRIPKLSDYYKNYHNFFCRPTFRNYKICEIMHNYGDIKAEIFYRNNYQTSKNEDKDNESSNKTSLSSLDNLTNNKTIFDKKTRTILDNINNNSSNKLTLTLDTSRTLKSNLNLLSKRSKDDSFIKSISFLINYQNIILKDNKKNEKNNQNKTTSNPNRNKNIERNKFSLKTKLMNNNNIKSSLYNLVKNNLNCETIKHNQKRILKSPKLKSYLSNYKSNLEEFNKNKLKYLEKINNGNDKLKNKTINTNNNNTNNLNSNFRNFSKLSATLNNNINNHFLFSSTFRNNSVTSHQKKNLNQNNNNGSNSKTKNSNKIIQNGNSIHNSGITIQKSKNITYDVKIFNSMNNLTKFNSNSNFSCFNYNQSTLRTNRKSSFGSNFNLVKTPINEINGSSNSYKNKFSKNKNFHGNHNNNNSKNSLIINPSSSLPKYNKKDNIKISKDKNLINYKKKNINISQNTINFNNLLFSVQKNKKNNHNLISPNGFQSNRIGINLNVCNGSRNKKNILTHTQTNIKTFRKDIMSHKTKSLDEEKLKLKNIFFGNKKIHHYQMSQRLVNQIEEIIKKSKTPFMKYNIGINNNLNNHKKTIEISNSSLHNNNSGSNMSLKLGSNKTINVNMKINSEDRKEKIIKMISPKK